MYVHGIKGRWATRIGYPRKKGLTEMRIKEKRSGLNRQVLVMGQYVRYM